MSENKKVTFYQEVVVNYDDHFTDRTKQSVHSYTVVQLYDTHNANEDNVRRRSVRQILRAIERRVAPIAIRVALTVRDACCFA